MLWIKEKWKKIHALISVSQVFKSIDLFAGAGGLSCGLTHEGIESVVAVEIEKDFSETFKLNHKDCFFINDENFIFPDNIFSLIFILRKDSR